MSEFSNGKSVGIKEAADKIVKGLQEYDQNVADRVKDVVDEIAEKSVKELKDTSPKRTKNRAKSYAGNWRVRESYTDRRTKRNTVHNRKKYQLTHLLEYGHASRNGGRVRAIEHIKPVEENAIKELEKRIEKAAKEV